MDDWEMNEDDLADIKAWIPTKIDINFAKEALLYSSMYWFVPIFDPPSIGWISNEYQEVECWVKSIEALIRWSKK